MAALEIKLFYFINKTCVNAACDFLAPILAFLSEYNVSLALALMLILVTRKEKKMTGIVFLAGLLASGFVVFLFKTGFHRDAPFVALENVRQAVEELDPASSFPSGHTTCAFLTATVFSLYFKRGHLLFFFAIAAAFIRVYNGVHYVSDVTAGAVIGVTTGYVMFHGAQVVQRFIGSERIDKLLSLIFSERPHPAV